MKTAISIPDSLFHATERLAKRLGQSLIIVQSDAFNKSYTQTVVVAVITSNTQLSTAPGNVMLPRRQSRPPKDSLVIA
jgi:mRNA interferase MazF